MRGGAEEGEAAPAHRVLVVTHTYTDKCERLHRAKHTLTPTRCNAGKPVRVCVPGEGSSAGMRGTGT